MAAMLRLQRSDGLRFDLPAGPGLCETCRERPARRSGYCSALCRVFDTALGAMIAARLDADGDQLAPAVVLARTRLRAVATVYDAARLRRSAADRITHGAAADWSADVAAGLLLPMAYADALSWARLLVSAGDRGGWVDASG